MLSTKYVDWRLEEEVQFEPKVGLLGEPFLGEHEALIHEGLQLRAEVHSHYRG